MNKFSKIIVEMGNHLLPVMFSAILIFTCAVTTPLNGEILLGLGIIFCATLSIILFIIKDNTIIKLSLNGNIIDALNLQAKQLKVKNYELQMINCAIDRDCRGGVSPPAGG